MFQFELVITEKCNLNCSYCYMKNQDKTMDAYTFMDHLEFLPEIMKLYNQERFATVFFGGEPLLNWDLISFAVTQLDKTESMTIPTNGLLLNEEMISLIKLYNIHLSLSFDGLWQKMPGPDIFKMWKDLNVCPKVMISPQRTTSIAENYEWFVKHFHPNPDFSIVRDDIWSDEDVRQFKWEIAEFADRVIVYNQRGIQTFPPPFALYFLDSYFGRKYGKRSFGCFAGNNGGGFMPDGKVYPCARYGSQKTLGAIANSIKKEIYWTEHDIHTFKNYIDPRKFVDCKQCDYYQFCNTGCTFSQFKDAYDDMGKTVWKFGPVKNVCELMKECYNQTFRIIRELSGNDMFEQTLKNLVKEFQNG